MQTLKQNKLLIIMALIITGLLTGCGGSGPSATVEKFFYALEDGDTDEAIDQLSSQVVAMVGRDKMAVGMVDGQSEIEAVGGIDSIDTEETINGETASVAYTINYGDGSSETDRMDLIQEDGDWKIMVSK